MNIDPLNLLYPPSAKSRRRVPLGPAFLYFLRLRTWAAFVVRWVLVLYFAFFGGQAVFHLLKGAFAPPLPPPSRPQVQRRTFPDRPRDILHPVFFPASVSRERLEQGEFGAKRK